MLVKLIDHIDLYFLQDESPYVKTSDLRHILIKMRDLFPDHFCKLNKQDEDECAYCNLLQLIGDI